MKLEVLNTEGKTSGKTLNISDDVFGIEPHEHSVYLVVKAYRAAMRQGTHAVKERNAVVGSGKKIKKQKGTGTARAGDIKNPLFRGGGRVFGPRQRKYNLKVNRKVQKLAKRSVFSQKMKEKNLKVIEDFSFESPKTKNFANLLAALDVDTGKSILITDGSDKNVVLSGRNIPNTVVSNSHAYNVYDVLNADTVVLTESALEAINESLS